MSAAILIAASLAQFNDAWGRARCGDTIEVHGTVTGAAPNNKRCPAGHEITLDLSHGGTMVNTYGRNDAGLIVRGGTARATAKYSSGLRFDNSRAITVDGTTLVGTDGTLGSGLLAINADAITLRNAHCSLLLVCAAFNDVTNVVVRNVAITGQGGDGIELYGVAGAVIDGLTSFDMRIANTVHPDIVQMSSLPGHIMTRNIVVRNVRGSGATQGISGFNPPYENILVENIDVSSFDSPQGVSINGVKGLTLRNIRLATLPGSRWQTVLNLVPGKNSGLIVDNVDVAPYKRWRAMRFPALSKR